MKTAINIRLDNDLLEILNQTASVTNLSRTTLIERAILAYQDKMDEMIGDQILGEIKKGKAKLIPLEEFMEKTGLNNV